MAILLDVQFKQKCPVSNHNKVYATNVPGNSWPILNHADKGQALDGVNR